MQSSRETEIKLEVRVPRPLRRRLSELGFAVLVRRRRERNILFDTADFRLRKAKCMLRLRSEGKRNLLTFKGAPQPSRSYKVRPEIETEVQSATSLESILGALGLRVVFRYEKFRTTYAQRMRSSREVGGLAEFDETPIGNYLELEGPKRWIDTIAKSLGYARAEYVTASYAMLHEQYCSRRRIRPRHMTFRGRKS